MKIAFTTTDRVHINAHFGWAQEIDVYEISSSGYEFLETLNFGGETKKVEEVEPKKSTGGCKHGKSGCKKGGDDALHSEVEPKKAEVKSQKGKDGDSDDKTAPKLEALADCTIVYVASIGGVPAAKLIKQGVMPVKARSEQEEIAAILNKLVQTLKGNPPPWLRKALQQNNQTVGELQPIH
ncbi:NifB/NifX family molybdenum-iron cluster-binding protein [Nostoc punctiforme UO1]|uniref:NifB/NifX family molybdenum-iron cluster-binding protein n=1 Tax=Nostoc punctiforme TaxID=272131 RepID=UPI0030A03750